MTKSRLPQVQTLTLNNYSFESVDHFKYLGSIVNKTNDCSQEISERLKMGNKAFASLYKILGSNLLTKASKIRLYKTLIVPIILYGSETWTMKKCDENRLDVFERKILRRILGPIREDDGTYRLRYNDECMKELKEAPVSAKVKIKQLKWAGHVVRMDASNPTHKTFIGVAAGKRNIGRPKLRWIDNIEKTATAIGRRNWRILAPDRDRWRSVLREAQIHFGSLRQP